MHPEVVIPLATRVVYGTPYLSGDLKVFWGKLLVHVFTDTLTPVQIQQREIASAADPLTEEQEINEALQTAGSEGRNSAAALLIMLRDQAISLKDFRAERAIQKRLALFMSFSDEHGIQSALRMVKEKVLQGKNERVFEINVSATLFLIDWVFRFTAAALMLASGASLEELIQIQYLLSFPILFSAWLLSKRSFKRNVALVKASGLEVPFRFSFHVKSSLKVSIILLGIAGALIPFFLADEHNLLILLTTLGVLGVYYFVLYRFFAMGRIDKEQFEQTTTTEEEPEWTADENDEVIVNLESELNAQNSRLDAYVLESALFGALAFSGFLQIIATDLINFGDLETFSHAVFMSGRGLLTNDSEILNEFVLVLQKKESLFSLIAIETLVCSGLFLAVIAARLRFSDFSDHVRSTLSLARAYNEKEEALLHSNGDQRLGLLTRRVNGYLKESRSGIARIQPIVSYMLFFRNSGILVFLLVLASSSLFISGLLSGLFVLGAILSQFYFSWREVKNKLIESYLSFLIFFNKRPVFILVVCFLPGILALFMSIVFNVNGTDPLLSLTTFLLGISAYVWLVLMPHFDTRFGDIENLVSERWRTSHYRIIKNLYGFFLLLVTAGLIMKNQHITGADEVTLISLSLLALSSYAMGFYLSRPRWVGIIVGCMMGTAMIGLLFLELTLQGAQEMLNISFIAQILFFTFYLFRPRLFHFILLRIVIVLACLTLYYSNFIFKPSLSMRINLVHAHHNWHYQQYIDLLAQIPEPTSNQFDSLTIKKQANNLADYLTKNPPERHICKRFRYFFTCAAASHYDEWLQKSDSSAYTLGDYALQQVALIDSSTSAVLDFELDKEEIQRLETSDAVKSFMEQRIRYLYHQSSR